jgi:sodium transport system permease protein
MRFHIVRTIVLKELKETLRDRRTLMMMIVLPVLLYPLMIIAFSKLQMSQIEATAERPSKVAVWGAFPEGIATPFTRDDRLVVRAWEGIPPAVREGLERRTLTMPALQEKKPTKPGAPPLARRSPREVENPVLEAARRAITSRTVDAVLVVWPDMSDVVGGGQAGHVSVYYDSVREDSSEARDRLAAQLEAYRKDVVASRERSRGLAEGFSVALEVRDANVAAESRQVGQILGMMLPFLLITMSLLGGFYPAIDLTAGEKERNTMQTLLCAPLKPLEIIAAKFLAVWAISLMAVACNVVSLGATLMRIIPGEQLSVAPGTLALAFVMLVPVSMLTTAVFLALASFAKGFKDAQNLLTPVYMCLAMPAGVSMLRGIELNAWTAFVPVVNIALLIKALLMKEAAGDLVFLVLVSSTAFAVLALVLASRVFEREQVLLGGRESVRAIFGLDRRGPGSIGPGGALTLFAVVLVVAFYASLLLQRAGMVTTLLVTEYGFFLVPALAMVALLRAPFRETLSLRLPSPMGFVAAVLIGLSAWTVAAGLLIRLLPPPESLAKALEKLLLLDGRPASLWVVWLVIAVTPALCEEILFRGVILAGLRRLGVWPALLVCGLLFGVAHASIYRLLPTMFLGILLTWLVWRTGSIWTAVVAHAINNGIGATLVHKPELAKTLGLVGDVYLSWTACAVGSVILLVGLAILMRVGPKSEGPVALRT